MGIVVEDVVNLLKHSYHFPNVEYIEHYIEHRAGDPQGNHIFTVVPYIFITTTVQQCNRKKELKNTSVISSIKNIRK